MIDEGAQASQILMCAKSPWIPAIRREHALAMTAAEAGYRVNFVERAFDVRALKSATRRMPAPLTPPDLIVTRRFTPVPGHRNAIAYGLDSAGLRRTLTRSVAQHGTPDSVVVNAPWNFAATAALPRGVRRVFDIADDWRTLLPGRRELITRCYRQIADEADEIIVAAPGLADLFNREVLLVPNATAPELLDRAVTSMPGGRRMVYVGTLSERFDAELMSAVLDLLPDWSLDLYGACHYAGHGDAPDDGLSALLARHSGRANWHGLVARVGLSEVLDRADVLVLPNDPSISAGQDSMKLYDYAARARPIVATTMRLPVDRPRGLLQAAGATEFAAAVVVAAELDAAANRRWAERNTWADRLSFWLDGVLGSVGSQSRRAS
ncbi:MAG: hypothetical protein JWN95_3576 [Frankiales bacterium]|nr:hypothetical protein [Frankiales bacterium]